MDHYPVGRQLFSKRRFCLSLGLAIVGLVPAFAQTHVDWTALSVLAPGTSPDLTIAKTHTGNFTQGQVGATYTISVSNVGGTATNGVVTVNDIVPAGLTATAISGPGWTCTQPSGPCTRSDVLGGLGASAPIIFTLSAVGSGTIGATPFTNALVTFTQATNTANIISCGTGLPCALNTPTNTLTIAGIGTFIIPVNTFFFNNQVGNPPGVLGVNRTGSSDFIDVQNAAFIAYDLKSALGPISGNLVLGNTATIPTTGGTVNVAFANTATFTAALGTPAAASYPPLTLTVNVAGNAPATVTNTATVSGGGETNTANDTATDPTTITAGLGVPDLTITKTHVGNFTQGQVGATYNITVSNLNATPSSGTVTVTDLLPAGLTAMGISGTGWTCIQPSGPCTRSDALGGGAAPAPIVFTLSAVGSGTIGATPFTNALVTFTQATNTANIISCGTGLPCAVNTTTNTVTIAGIGTFIIPVNTFFFNNQVGNPPGVLGVNRTGSSDFIDVQNPVFLAYDLKSALGPISGNVVNGNTAAIPTSGGTVNVTFANTATFTAVLGPPAPANYPPLTLTVNVAANAPASITNTATVSGGGETNTANDTANDPTTVNPSGGGGGVAGPDLQVLKFHAGDFTPGQTGAIYTIQVLNVGAAPSSGPVQVVDNLPAGLTATAISGSGWNCILATLTCTIDGSSRRFAPITLVVNVAANAPSSVVNTATVSGGGDINNSNNTAKDPTNITVIGGRSR